MHSSCVSLRSRHHNKIFWHSLLVIFFQEINILINTSLFYILLFTPKVYSLFDEIASLLSHAISIYFMYLFHVFHVFVSIQVPESKLIFGVLC